MNKKSLGVALLAILNLAPVAFGDPTSYFYLIQKQIEYDQTGPSTTQIQATPYRFTGQVGNDPQDANTPASSISITLPNSTVQPLTFDSQSGEWKFKTSFSNQLSMDSAFPDGTYTFTVGSSSGTVGLNGDIYPNTPVASVSGGTFSGSTLYVLPGVDLTIMSNNFTTNFVSGQSRVGVEVDPNGNGATQTFAFDSLDGQDDPIPLTATNGTVTVPGADLLAGQSYQAQIEFDAFSSTNTTIPSGEIVGLYSTRTSFNIQVIPEPAETALLAGLLGLGLVGWRRRLARA